MNIARSTSKIFFARLSGSVFGFLGTVYFARELGTSLFGTFVLFQALSQMLAVPADFGLQGAVIKRMSEREKTRRGSFDSHTDARVLSYLRQCLRPSLRNIINSYLGAKLAVFLVTVVILNELSKLAQNVLKGELRVGETASLNFTKQLTFNGLGAILLFTSADVLALVYALITSSVIVLLWGFTNGIHL